MQDISYDVDENDKSFKWTHDRINLKGIMVFRESPGPTSGVMIYKIHKDDFINENEKNLLHGKPDILINLRADTLGFYPDCTAYRETVYYTKKVVRGEVHDDLVKGWVNELRAVRGISSPEEDVDAFTNVILSQTKKVLDSESMHSGYEGFDFTIFKEDFTSPITPNDDDVLYDWLREHFGNGYSIAEIGILHKGARLVNGFVLPIVRDIYWTSKARK